MGPLFKRREHRTYPQATDFFVIGERQVQRHTQRPREKRRDRRQHRGNEALHVRSAAPVQAPITFAQGKRLDRPGLAVHRHHVGVPRQHHTAHVLRADGGKQVGLGAFGVMEQLAVHAKTRQVVTDKANQRQVGIAADRGKADQPGKQRAAGELTHSPVPRSLALP
ncbi:hypothetical protein D3C80_1337890 [compost metagenome]